MDNFENLLKSAKNYLNSGKFSEAIGLYERTLKEAKPEEKAKIKKELAYCLLRSGELDSALNEAKEAEEGFARLGDKIELTRARLLVANVLLEIGRSEDAWNLSMEVYESYKQSEHHRVVGLSQRFLGRAFAQLGDYGQANDYFQDSLSTFRRADDERETLIAYNCIANVNFATSKYDRALMNLEKGLVIAQKRRRKRDEALILGNIGSVYRKMGKWQLARGYLKQSLDFFEKLGDKIEIARRNLASGRLDLLLRNWDNASKHFERALIISQEHGYEREEAMSLESLGDLAKERGDLDLARDYYQRTLDIGRRLAQKDLINQVQRRRAELLIMEGKDLEEASKCCEEALKVSQSLGDRLEEGCCFKVQALIHEARGNLEGVRGNFEKAVRILESIEDKFELGRTLLEQGRFIASVFKQREKGLDLLQGADRLFSEIGPECQYYRGLARMQMARVEMLFSHPDEALNFIAQAEAIFGELEEKDALKDTAKHRSQVERHLDRATNSEENPYLLLKELSLKPPSEAGLRSHLKSLLHTLTQRVGADLGFVAYRETVGLKVAERVKLREEEAEKALHLLAANSLEPGRLMIKLSADGKFSPLKVGAFLVMPLGLKGRLDGILYLAKKPGRIGWRQDDVNFFVAASEHIYRIVADLRVEGLEAENLVLRAYQIADRYGFPRLITEDGRMKKVLRKIDRVKDAQEPVLLTGESGTGKELVARLIHYSGQRALGPFVTVDCASITESLLEDELYGHVKGAFTGATQERRGRFEEANGGGIFLDEISTLKPDLQAKLLRVLEEGEVQRRGDNRWRRVDVRVIAATNKDLQAEVKAGSFREDVFYRLNCFTIELPPLRERKGDIALLVDHFIGVSCRDNGGKQIRGVTPEAMEVLMEYDYPGNVRELRNLIRRAVTFTDDGEMITPTLVSFSGRGKRGFSESSLNLRKRVEKVEAQTIAKALSLHSWNKTKVAKTLGISYPSLLKKIKSYGLRQTQA
jgi:DNA-binding NtrC family response regulator/tetratricopeptide (TPR) repeat protein